MPKGENTNNHPGRQVGRERWEIGRSTQTGSERVGYHLTGGGASDPYRHGAQRFGSHEAAMSYAEKHRLQLKPPTPGPQGNPYD